MRPDMIRIRQLVVISVLLTAALSVSEAISAPRPAADANNKALAKLQASVKDITTERDTLKTEKDKITAELEQLKKAKEQAATNEERLNAELQAQKNTNSTVSGTLEQTHAKLVEVIEKYNNLNKAKNELTATYTQLDATQKQTSTELQTCEAKNIKLYDAGKEVLAHYEGKNVFDSVLKAEPILQFKSVELEGLVQEYEDKLRSQKYQHKEPVAQTSK